MRQLTFSFVFLLLASVSALSQDINEQLLAAARKGDLVSARALLEKGADANTKTRYGASPLSYACDRGNLELVKLLIEKGADVDARDTFYKVTPIIWAAQKGHAGIVRLLLEKGAKGKDDAMSIAIEEGSVPVAQAVLDIGVASQDSLNNWLNLATRAEKPEIAQLLTKAGAKVVVLAEFKIAPETMLTYTGVYRNEGSEFSFSIKESKLVAKTSQREFVLTSTAQYTFEAADAPGIKLVFSLENEKATSVTFRQAGAPDTLLKKVEAK